MKNSFFNTADSWGRCTQRIHLTFENSQSTPTKIIPYLFDDQKELGAYPDELRVLGQGRGAEIGAAVAIEKNGLLYIPLHDLFGNIIALLTPEGQHVESYRFSSFGEEIAPHQPLIPWRYQSKRKVAHLVNFGRRFYDPNTGRWLSPDPKGFDEGPNLYQYLRNSPYLRYDLYGEMVERDPEKLATQIIHRPDLERRMGPPYSYNVEYTPQMGMTELKDHPRDKPEIMMGGVCGIQTDAPRMEEFLSMLSSIAGGIRVEGTFAPSKGIVKDVFRANIAHQLVATETSYLILERWRNFFENNTPNALYLEVPSSRGSIDAELALLMAPREIRERIIIVALAPAKFISSLFCREAVNYVTKFDLVPQLQKDLAYAKSPDPNVITLDENNPTFLGKHGFDEDVYSTSLSDEILRVFGIVNEP